MHEKVLGPIGVDRPDIELNLKADIADADVAIGGINIHHPGIARQVGSYNI
ncbi:hypothetical protein [Rhizobium sp. J15]|uniref:hypothetical protein n=1 Tax=Rhizobium sp. J15 TaxID=2035450 RepID=UPI001596DB8A|nr:hypothetical protein [Rhizobium sp. J15]